MRKTIVGLGILFASLTSATFAADAQNLAMLTTTETRITPLCTAISKGETEIVKKFIEYGADVNEKSNGMTPLMVAARYNNTEIMEYLISKGANVNLKSESGLTAMKYAELSNAGEAVSFLQKYKKR